MIEKIGAIMGIFIVIFIIACFCALFLGILVFLLRKLGVLPERNKKGKNGEEEKESRKK